MNGFSRLIEHSFPLRQASIDSVHEKNVRHGHISTLHIWPARRPLAASRAALLATLLPDPGTSISRKELCEQIGGKLKRETDKDGRVKEVTDGGVLRWKREIENKAALDWFRGEIRQANGGTSPKVLDPFAGGGAIPLEAMRLGCDVTAADLNPVAWFILKCTLEYPQKLAGQTLPLPEFILSDREFMEEFLKKVGHLKGVKLRKTLEVLGHRLRPGEQQQDEFNFEGAAANVGISLDADLAWHVRAWGRKILSGARKQLASFYPTYADWQPVIAAEPFDPLPTTLVGVNANGVADAATLNADLTDDYLNKKTNPRWIAKPPVAYLWARTVTCKNCRATIPLLKTRWLCKKENKRILLMMEPKADRTGIMFSIKEGAAERGGNAAQKREHDKKLGAGTMSKAGAQCQCCPAIMDSEDIRYEGKNGRLGHVITAVVVDGPNGKEYRQPTTLERELTGLAKDACESLFSSIPYGFPTEQTPGPSGSKFNSSSLRIYGFESWKQIFTDRQLLSLGIFVQQIREFDNAAIQAMYPDDWREAIAAYLGCAFSRLVDYSSEICIWALGEFICHTFTRYALPITWDFVEGNPIGFTSGNFAGALEWVGLVLDHILAGVGGAVPAPHCLCQSALKLSSGDFDIIITDPPYYDAIAYGDLMDFFQVWLKRIFAGGSLGDLGRILDIQSSRWSPKEGDGELIDNPVLYSGDKSKSKEAYENGMQRAFEKCYQHLNSNGKMVVVFAHKHPDAWEALVSAMLRAGFVVDGSWPIQTERETRMRAYASAALSSSVWLVCRKRDPQAKVGWDNRVLAEMRENIKTQLREFWDAGIRGPDFVWAATGPAMEAFSKFPAVKKANSPANEFLSVKEFLEAVRRIVIEFVVGRVLHIESGTDRLDSVTSYYLLHRNDFAFEKAPAGACILYAVSCGLSDAELERTWNLVNVKGSTTPPEGEYSDEDADEEGESAEEIGGAEFVLRTWKERNDKRMGFESVGGREVPLIDRVHRLMHLWREGDVRKVDDYLDQYALRRHELFVRLIQSLIELSERGSDERTLLESLSNHLGTKDAKVDTTGSLVFEDQV